MYVVMGATGHVGSGVATELLRQGLPVTAVVRDEARGADLKARGATLAVADVCDVPALRAAFRQGRRAFLLNPPAEVAGDTDAEERRTGRCIVAALEGSGLEKVVAMSTYGAQAGEHIGDLGTLHAFEHGLRHQNIPLAIVRAAYLFTNWDGQAEAVRATGRLRTPYPPELPIPMVAPEDVARVAATLLTGPEAGVRHVEGPQRCTTAMVAADFAQVLKRPVELDVIPRDQWEAAFMRQGFSPAAARSFARMTAASMDGGFELPASPVVGAITLMEHLRALSPA